MTYVNTTEAPPPATIVQILPVLFRMVNFNEAPVLASRSAMYCSWKSFLCFMGNNFNENKAISTFLPVSSATFINPYFTGEIPSKRSREFHWLVVSRLPLFGAEEIGGLVQFRGQIQDVDLVIEDNQRIDLKVGEVKRFVDGIQRRNEFLDSPEVRLIAGLREELDLL